VTCDFAEMKDEGVVYCLAPPVIDIRWRWRELQPGRPHLDGGSMCAGHWMLACEQLAADPEIERESIQVMRREESS
jgi:hypothetical protein